MKDLGETIFCLGLHIGHLVRVIFLHQSLYTQKIFKHFSMDATQPLISPMVMQSSDLKKEEFKPCNEEDKWLGPTTSYVATIGALMYLANFTRPDIAFAIFLVIFSVKPTNGTGMASNMSYDTSKARRIQYCFIKLERIATSNDTCMQVISRIHVKGNHKHVMFFSYNEQQYLGNV